MSASSEYYEKHYAVAQRTGLQGWGNSLIDRQVERHVVRRPGDRILEIGASSGEHLAFVSGQPAPSAYVALDLQPRITDPERAAELERSGRVEFVEGDAAAMAFDDAEFDVSVSTCVLAHVSDPEAVFQELRRVTRPGGCIVVGMPCDPGMANRLVKSLVTYRAMTAAGVDNPRLSYAREHSNGIGNLIVLAKHVFREDDAVFRYFPFGIPSWNANLAVTLRVIKSPSGG